MRTSCGNTKENENPIKLYDIYSLRFHEKKWMISGVKGTSDFRQSEAEKILEYTKQGRAQCLTFSFVFDIGEDGEVFLTQLFFKK